MFNELRKSKLFKELTPVRPHFLMVFFFSLFVNLLMIVPAMYMLQVYDRAVGSRSESTLLMLSLIMVFLLLSMGGLDWVRSQVLVRAGAKIDEILSERLYNASFMQALYSGGLKANAQPLADLSSLRQFLTGAGILAAFDAPWVPVYIGIMWLFHPWFGILGIFSILFLVSLTLLNQRMTNPLLEEANKQSIANSNDTARNLRNAEVVESMGMLGSIRERWRERNFNVMGYQAEASDKGGALTATSKSMRQILQSCALGMGAYLTINQELTGGMMIAGSILLGRALAPIDQLVGNWKGYVAALGQMERIDVLLETIPDETERMDLPPPTGAITVEGITVVPPGGNLPVLSGVNFSLAAGESLAVIGPSAAGKSSLARVLLGVWPASNGFVRLDSADVFQWDREQLGSHIGYLPQDVELFDGTISDNIARFGEVDSEKIVVAARLAGVHDMILRLPEGYDTVIGASGGVLSGGQRQRIGLARAVYNEPRIVVLDEPNSNLDEVGEAALREALLQLRAQGTTVIIISHRTSVLTVMDKILVLRDGAMVEFGPAKEVVQKFQQAKAQLTAQSQAKVTASQTTPVQTVAIPNS